MPIVAIYNNKGGEGKSTVTVGLAEFLAANLNKRVLVIDLDAQASSSCALVGHKDVNAAIERKRTIADLLGRVRQERQTLEDISDYLVHRPASGARGSALGALSVIVPDGDRLCELEEQMNRRRHHSLLRQYARSAFGEFDYVLVDMPGNVVPSSLASINGLTMSDFVLVPVRPSRISLNGLPRTFDIIGRAQSHSEDGQPAVIGLLRNATDRRFQQYKANFPALLEAAKLKQLPPIFDRLWPPSPALESATDEKRNARTLKERFGNSYDHARLVARELHKRCSRWRRPAQPRRVRRSIWSLLGLR